MSPEPPPSIRSALRSALLSAMKRRDQTAVTTYRTAMAAIDNAEAVPLTDEHKTSAIEASPVGAGSTEVARRSLTEADLVAIVRAESTEHRAAADQVAAVDPATARRLREQAGLIDQLLSAYELKGA